MISVTIWRKTLVANHACGAGLALFDAIASQQPESDPRRLRRIHVRDLPLPARELLREEVAPPWRAEQAREEFLAAFEWIGSRWPEVSP